MSKIKAVTKDRKLVIVSRPALTSGSRNIDELSVVLDKTWNFDSADYYVNFFIDDDKNGIIRQLSVSGSVGRCEIPFYITKNDGFFHFGIFARADGDIVKTSDIVSYEVKKGICIESDGDNYDTPEELKKRFIDMINNKIIGSALSYDMSFEDIELNFGEYIDEYSEEMIEVGVLGDDLYNIIKEYVDSDAQKANNVKESLENFISILGEYFSINNPQFELDSVNSELLEFNGFKDNIYELITTYIDPDFNENSDFITYISTIEEHLVNAAEAAETISAIISNLYSLYTGGNE